MDLTGVTGWTGAGDDRENVGHSGLCGYEVIHLDPAEPVSPEYSRGYRNALNDVLNEIRREGKQHIVQWMEQQMKVIP